MIKVQMEKIYREMSPEDIPWNIETPPEILEAPERWANPKGRERQ
jgi:hypothetical protein